MAHEAHKIQWRLLRYARFTRSNETVQPAEKDQQSTSSQTGTWKYSSWCDAEPLIMSIQDSSYLLITRGKLILENHWLFDADHVIKGACRGDCILFMQRIKNECRKFRVKLMQGSFLSTVEACVDCVGTLRTFFPVRDEGMETTPQKTPASDRTTLQGEASLGSVAKVVLGREGLDLPLAYRHCNSSLRSGQLGSEGLDLPLAYRHCNSSLRSGQLGSEGLDLPLAYRHCNSSLRAGQLAEAIRLCLADPGFPAFVQSVEDELKTVMSEEFPPGGLT